MEKTAVALTRKEAEGYVIPIGPVNLVFVKTDTGFVGCGAFDVIALEKFGLPAAKVRPPAGANSVTSINDLLEGEIVLANAPAEARGIVPGMSGQKALDLL